MRKTAFFLCLLISVPRWLAAADTIGAPALPQFLLWFAGVSSLALTASVCVCFMLRSQVKRHRIDFMARKGVLEREIEERLQAEAQLQQLAYFDVLTGLPNRTLFRDRLTQVLEQAPRFSRQAALISVDIDRFKGINDALGTIQADQLLIAVANRLQGSLRGSDTVSRSGGDEFLLLLAAIHRGEAVAQVARKILTEMERPFEVNGQEVFVSVSLGIALYPADGIEADTLLKNAETAMFVAKQAGRKGGYQFFSREMNERSVERFALEGKLRRALERKEFFLHYQPQVDMKSGKMTGVEALLRWRHPELGVVAPGKFIPLAEETGLINPIGDWVLQTACAQNRAWQQQGAPVFRMAVNLSARQFNQADLVARVARVLHETRLPPGCLELEITESMLMENAELARAKLEDLKELEVLLAVDDFGTGYSSLSYLKNFPIDRLKIDNSFIRDITTDNGGAAIAEAIIAMAGSLRMCAIAEGVETREQLEILRDKKCNEMQGYYFARPMDAAALLNKLQTGAISVAH